MVSKPIAACLFAAPLVAQTRPGLFVREDMIPGGRSVIGDVNREFDKLHPDAGILWHGKQRYGPWVPPSVPTRRN